MADFIEGLMEDPDGPEPGSDEWDAAIRKEREFLEKAGGVFLAPDPWEDLMVRIFNGSMKFEAMGGYDIKEVVVGRYCDRYGLEFIETLELMQRFASKVYRALKNNG
jgi:hypothetical protein